MIIVQKAALKYVPLLAQEGVKYNVGGEHARGGLLKLAPRDARGRNINVEPIHSNQQRYEEELIALKILCMIPGNDSIKVQVLKELEQLKLLHKNDVLDQYLLDCATKYTGCRERFHYLASLDPDALLAFDARITRIIPPDVLEIILESGFQYFPKIGGLLFLPTREEYVTVLDYIIQTLGQENILNMLHRIFTPACNYPILHHVLTKAPQYKMIFTQKFPWAYKLKDHENRSLHQAVLAAGPKAMNNSEFLFATLSDNQIRTKDPITTLYPFAAMAAGEDADLERSYYLLRRHPSVLDAWSRVAVPVVVGEESRSTNRSSDSDNISNRQKRKRNTTDIISNDEIEYSERRDENTEEDS
ncbi:hypothetical protein CTEN210_18070 [Chaetoceros tenuissimus]|uniref:Uncharacterized protein n=1 Tax=Chaetoceros tenuissimus TaxID=426638 RepID=A0AAD3HFU3_9STRA|nr:hypothetical protein CTEN210_18070 [Chaetoceros tenuissimus]